MVNKMEDNQKNGLTAREKAEILTVAINEYLKITKEKAEKQEIEMREVLGTIERLVNNVRSIPQNNLRWERDFYKWKDDCIALEESYRLSTEILDKEGSMSQNTIDSIRDVF